MIEGAHGICDELPDGNTAKKYPLDQVYKNIEATSTPGGMSTTSSANLSTSKAARLNKIWNAMIFIAVSICSGWM